MPGLKDACRAYCLHVLCCAYRKAPLAVIGESLATSGAELDALVAEHCAKGGWVKEGDVRTTHLISSRLPCPLHVHAMRHAPAAARARVPSRVDRRILSTYSTSTLRT